MRKSLAWRFFIVGLLVLLMFIPLLFIGQVVDERADYNRDTRSELGREWGGPQALQGPYMRLRVDETILERKLLARTDPGTGEKLKDSTGQVLQEESTVSASHFKTYYVFPKTFDVAVDNKVIERRKGIFKVPVYTADVTIDFGFDPEDIARQIKEIPAGASTRTPNLGERIITSRKIRWDHAHIATQVANITALRGEPQLLADGEPLRVDPNDIGNGFVTQVNPKTAPKLQLKLQVNGSERFEIDPIGDLSHVVMTGDWPHPNFALTYLPDSYEVTDQGYEALWTIPRLARGLTSVSGGYEANRSLGVVFYQPNDFYQRSYRAVRYGILFIGLSFLTIFLIEGQTKRPTHPVQYILVGLVQSVFFLLLLGISEHLGFGLAYLIATLATVMLITSFGAFALKLRQRTLVLGCLLAALYAVLYLILKSTDFALLAGSVLIFVALAGTMFATRDQDWYEGSARDGGGWFVKGRAKPADTPPATQSDAQ